MRFKLYDFWTHGRVCVCESLMKYLSVHQLVFSLLLIRLKTNRFVINLRVTDTYVHFQSTFCFLYVSKCNTTMVNKVEIVSLSSIQYSPPPTSFSLESKKTYSNHYPALTINLHCFHSLEGRYLTFKLQKMKVNHVERQIYTKQQLGF